MNVLVLVGMELICFLVAGIVLCFGFSMKRTLIMQGCFSYWWAVLTQSQGLFCFSLHATREEAGGAQEAWRGHSHDSWPRLTQGIFHAVWHHAQHIKLREEEGRGTNGAMAFAFPCNPYMQWSPASLEMAEHLPADGQQGMNSFFCFACTRGFCFTY